MWGWPKVHVCGQNWMGGGGGGGGGGGDEVLFKLKVLHTYGSTIHSKKTSLLIGKHTD